MCMLMTCGGDSADVFFNAPGYFLDTKSLLDALRQLACDARKANFHGEILVSMNCGWKVDCNDDIGWRKRAQVVSQGVLFQGTLNCQRLLEIEDFIFDALCTCK